MITNDYVGTVSRHTTLRYVVLRCNALRRGYGMVSPSTGGTVWVLLIAVDKRCLVRCDCDRMVNGLYGIINVPP